MRTTHNPFPVTMRSPAPAKPWLESHLFVTLPRYHALLGRVVEGHFPLLPVMLLPVAEGE